MQRDDCFQLGHISRKHSFRGELILFLDTDYPENYEALGSILLDINGELVPFFLESSQLQRGKELRIKIEGIDDQNGAESLIGYEVWLPLDLLPPLSGKQFYFHEIIGFTAVDIELGELGVIRNVLETNAQNILLIEKDGKEILIPAIDPFIDRIDRAAKIMYLQTPEGLVDLYA
ncbi:MAG: ribosome maturation factor RimM [Bacteroidota bacterium]|nr:ribosome maturation factor RimM [Bacteroidota bacterium]MDX5426930.1 ribosome maturation factor RimM [Bacteroidota bacterium]MDX5504918.1 ribosome maturation factor RimM [Bacteroidota bacterium]